MHNEITKAEIRSRIFLKWDYEEHENGRITKLKASADAPIHEDLNNAFQALLPHFLLLTEMKKKPEIIKSLDLSEIPETLQKKYTIKGFSVDDNKGDLYYTIYGSKILNNGKIVSFQTPRTNRGASEEDMYEFFDKLEEKIEVIKEEVLEYMNGKQAAVNQTAMDFADDFEPEAEDQPNQENKLEEVA